MCDLASWLTGIGTFIVAIATILLAIGTFLVAFVAVFQDKIRRFLMKPRLEVSISLSPPDCLKTIMSDSVTMASADCFYFRIQVKNAGNISADNVEVYLESIKEERTDGSYKDRENFIPMGLNWSQILKPYMPRILPGLRKHCDFFHIVDPQTRQRIDSNYPDWNRAETIMRLDTEVYPTNLCHFLKKGKYQFYISIGADNIKPIRIMLEINHTGKWHPDESTMFKEGIFIKKHQLS